MPGSVFSAEAVAAETTSISPEKPCELGNGVLSWCNSERTWMFKVTLLPAATNGFTRIFARLTVPNGWTNDFPFSVTIPAWPGETAEARPFANSAVVPGSTATTWTLAESNTMFIWVAPTTSAPENICTSITTAPPAGTDTEGCAKNTSPLNWARDDTGASSRSTTPAITTRQFLLMALLLLLDSDREVLDDARSQVGP